MTVYVFRGDKLVPKRWSAPAPGGFPSPRVSRMESFESPIDGKSISSWRQRDRDMQAVDAVDRRDIPAKAFETRQKAIARMKEANNG
jgi:hypothetical protein